MRLTQEKFMNKWKYVINMKHMVGTIIISNYKSRRDPVGLVCRKGFMKEVKFELTTFSEKS